MAMKPAVLCVALMTLVAASALAKPATVPAHPIANGTFIQDYLVRQWDDARWQSEFRYMKELGMRYMVFGPGIDGKSRMASYPTHVPGYRLNKGYKDPLDACLRNAQKAGIKVFVGLNFHPDWWQKGVSDSAWLNDQMAEGNLFADEMYQRYHSRYPKAFYGWYWVWEVDNLNLQTPVKQETLAKALDISVRHLKGLNASMPVMLCPFMNYRLGFPDQYRAFWQYVFAHCALGKGDIFAPQDCVGAGGLNIDNFPEWFASLREAVDTKPGLKFWSDTETFYQEDWTSATLDRFVRQLKGVRPYVEDSITFAWSHYYSPNNVPYGWHKTYLQYVRTGKLESVPPSAPRNLRAVHEANGDVRVTWDPSTDNVGVAGYYVYRNGVRVSRNRASTGPGPKTGPPAVYIDKATTLASSASYEVQAHDFAGNVSRKIGPVAVGPAPLKLTGGFIQYQDWMMKLSAEDWRKELALMRKAGMDLVIVQWLTADGERFIPSAPTAVDPTRVILEEADRTGMQVFVGLTTDEEWWRHSTEADYLGRATQESIAIAREAWKRYGKHKSFAGWYMPQETSDADYDAGQIKRLRTFFRTVADRCRELSEGKPVACSPFIAGNVPPETVQRVYTDLLTGSGLDILMPQDSVGARGWDSDVAGKVVPYYRAFQAACSAAGVKLWADVESFKIVNGLPLNGKPTEYVPADAPRLGRQMAAESPYVNRFVTFDFFHYMSPQRGALTKALYDGYVELYGAPRNTPGGARPLSKRTGLKH